MKVIAYYRVSTQKQGRSGLGLEAQEAAISAYSAPIKSFTEIESGKNSARPELAKAIASCKQSGATLVVAKLDRLARNVAFVSALMESGIEFVACDNPNANRLTVHILAAVAEDEARRISERTKAALAAAKRRGIQLGSQREGHWDGLEAARVAGGMKGRSVSVKVRSKKASEFVEFFAPRVTNLKALGLSHRQVAKALNDEGFTTPRGSQFSKSTISRLLWMET